MSAKRIHLLEPRLANQIAAGEVIERPASVVKELVENSLDADATRIEIDIVNGGLQLIRIRDNGTGICQADLPLAVSRHATSKVATLADVEYLQSLGFRGEALASISSVSRFVLTSNTADKDTGWQVKLEGNDMLPSLSPAAHPQGTTVEVAELFFNTPARRKFMRSEQTEWHHILELIKRIALSRFDVGFYLTHQQRNILQLRTAEGESARQRRLQDICGTTFVHHSVALECIAQDVKLSGWIGLPSDAPTLPSPQYFYINGRMVRDRLLLHAVRQAYEGLLPDGRHPVYVLYLELDPGAVDVNVHPTKHEVRFRESRLIHDFIFSHLRKTLMNDVPTLSSGQYQAPVLGHQVAEQMALYSVLQGTDTHPPLQSRKPALSQPKLGIPLGQLHTRYLLIQQPTGLGIIDLGMAYEQLIYKTLQQTLINDSVLKAQPLLIPATLAITESLQDLLEAKQALFNQCGIDLNLLGNQQVILRTLPAAFRNAEVTVILETLLVALKQQQSALTAEDILKALAKAYFAAAKQLELNEINELLHQLADDHSISQQCLVEFSLKDIGKLFSRDE